MLTLQNKSTNPELQIAEDSVLSDSFFEQTIANQIHVNLLQQSQDQLQNGGDSPMLDETVQ